MGNFIIVFIDCSSQDGMGPFCFYNVRYNFETVDPLDSVETKMKSEVTEEVRCNGHIIKCVTEW